MNTSQPTRLWQTIWPRYRLISLFAAITATALLIWFVRLEPTYFQGPALVLLVEFIAAAAMTEVLTRNPPQAVRRAVRSNCTRGNGSWSAKRASIENHALWRVRFNLWVAFLLAFTLLNGALYFVNTQATPLSFGLKALRNFHVQRDVWKKQIRSQGNEAAKDVLAVDHRDRIHLASQKPLVIKSFAIVGGIGLLVSLSFILLIRNSYFYSITEFLAGASARSFEYELHDRQVRW